MECFVVMRFHSMFRQPISVREIRSVVNSNQSERGNLGHERSRGVLLHLVISLDQSDCLYLHISRAITSTHEA